MKRTMMAACILSLVACGGSKDDVATDQRQDWESRVQSLVYSFPDNAQQEVPTSSPVVLRFSSPVRTGNAALHDKIVLRDSNNTKIGWADIEEVDNGQSLLLHPQQKLSPLTTYQLSIAPIELQKGETRARNLTFSTRAAYEGPKSLVAEDKFTILRTLPNDLTYGATDTPVDIMEFTTFRVQFSQPLDRSTVKYGDVPGDSTVQLTGPDGLIDAHVIVSGPYLTIDPKEDLQPDVPHRITFTTGVKSIYGDTMPGGSFGNENDTTAKTIDFTPKATGPRGNMVQDIADTLGKVSPLTGRQINEVPMASVLLGEDTATQASGIVAAELAFVPDFPDATPLRVKRGSLIEGASIDVLIGGEVPAGFESGKVRMDFLSDATGYLLPNPYSDTDDAPRQVRLWMDVAVSTETPQANGAITQDLLHIELVGTSLVDPETKLMTINAVGVVEPNVLGSEYASGLLSFYMEEVGDQDNPPVMVEDTTGPVLQSWIPGENAHLHKPGDPIIFNFDEPIDPESVKGKVRLFHNDNPMEIDYYVDGSALVIKPKSVREENEFGVKVVAVEALEYSSQKSRSSYRLEIADGLADTAGNRAASFPLSKEFELAIKISNEADDLISQMPAGAVGIPYSGMLQKRAVNSAPIVLAAYPGFPCALWQEYLDDRGLGERDPLRNLALGRAGRCAGGHPGIEDGKSSDNKSPDDAIPVMELPANRPIVVYFNREIDPGSVVLGETFVVEAIDDNEAPFGGAIKGELAIEGSLLRFSPLEPWSDGQLYRYRLRSSGYELSNTSPISIVASNNYKCGLDAICGLNGKPLHTQPVGLTEVYKYPNAPTSWDRDYSLRPTGPEMTAGGPDFVHFFRGGQRTEKVLQLLTSQPVADTNNNFFAERSDLGTTIAVEGFVYPPLPGELDLSFEEYGPSDIPSNSYPEYDPDGLVPSPNSAKLLSRFRTDVENLLEVGAGYGSPLLGANIGCSYVMNPTTYEVVGPDICPEHKFTYLVSAVLAEITNEKVDNRLKVNLWPAVILGTNLKVTAFQDTTESGGGAGPFPGLSGRQLLRMRYSGAERNEPITAWVEERNGESFLTAELQLYIDAPYIAEWSIGITNRMDLISYEVNMKLEGRVDFLEDGRMLVEQYNIEPVDILIKMHAGGSGSSFGNAGRFAGYVDLFIPEYGSRLNYVSQPIK